MQVHATDPDLGANGGVTYRLDEAAASSDIRDRFRVDSRDGKVYLRRALDYEEQSTYKVPIIATDKRHPVTSSATLTVRVRDVNDEQPIISVDFLGKQRAEIEENKAAHEPIAFVMVSDKDKGHLNSDVTCQLHNKEHDARYHLVKTKQENSQTQTQEYFLKTAKRLDREKLASDQIVLSCVDSGMPPLSASTTISLTVMDVNDNEPLLSLRSTMDRVVTEARVSENVPPHTAVVKVQAQDPDNGVNGTVTFSMDQSDPMTLQRFQIKTSHPREGVVITRTMLDREATQPPIDRFPVKVVARDGGGRTAEIHFSILLLDVNDNEPKFEENPQIFSVKEMKAKGTNLGQIRVSDLDNNAQIRVSIHHEDMRLGLPFEVRLSQSAKLSRLHSRKGMML